MPLFVYFQPWVEKEGCETVHGGLESTDNRCWQSENFRVKHDDVDDEDL